MVEIPSTVDIAKMTPQELAELQKRLVIARQAVTTKSIADRACELTPEEAKEALCDMTKDITNIMTTKNVTWPKVVLNAVRKAMEQK